ncbi:MAG: tetratricopeptide repeat protein [Isosphaeraceae bacterium]
MIRQSTHRMALILAVISVAEVRARAQPPRPETSEPLFEGLGSRTRKVTTSSPDAQRYFDQGLKFLYAFNHDEAIRSFRQATTLDPSCAMAWWGIAMAHGPHINNPVVPEARARAAWEAARQARAHADSGTPVERALIEAVATRYADPPPEDRTSLDRAFAEAMKGVWQAHPEDGDVGAFYAESLMDLRPWDLWTAEGTPQPGTEVIVTTLENVLGKDPEHPLAIHLYIHAVEASPDPGRAVEAADRLRDLTPGLPHLVHMPSHLDVRLGRWRAAEVANEKATEADRRYRAVRPDQGFYRLYMLHNHHMLAFAALMRGESARAIQAIDAMIAGVPADWARVNSAIADGVSAMPLEVRMRFGRWDEILKAPEPPEYFPIARALRLAARGASLAALGRVDEARAEEKKFEAARELVPETALVGNSPASTVLDVAGNLMAGEILYRAGDEEGAFDKLREAVKAEDALHYDEPPDWILPVRHALGAALMQSGRYAEAEPIYRADLKKHPENGWALFGLCRSLELQGKDDQAAAVRARFERAWADADVKLSSSCFCQPGV